MLSAVEACRLNHWTTGKFPAWGFFKLILLSLAFPRISITFIISTLNYEILCEVGHDLLSYSSVTWLWCFSFFLYYK